ncbi:MAG: hypothetical protein JWL96_3836 [Sphingomonas bacterium]|uniref:DUF72 domain-containing protein n=1 Tax=Sphingomonas bacterium TaxID=1895847 RepID=UPI0026370E34|nr:DUF72 domain-containing protein [Sphingomonas bacterium]MDB5711766.1 hypothetical protein [Sphingomonas bacterium]
MIARIGTAGWAIPAAARDGFPATGTGLERYAAGLNAVEINSSFHRPHRPATYQRWAAAVPPDFAFAVKLPKTITHVARLANAEEQLASFAAEVAGLGDKLGVILVQLPPSLAFDAIIAGAFFRHLARNMPAAHIACEPRHASWFTTEANDLLAALHVARVAADPAILPAAAQPGGWPGLRYYRLHGSPTIYRSSYDEHALAALATDMAPGDADIWCIFDNTASGAAIANALALRAMVSPGA